MMQFLKCKWVALCMLAGLLAACDETKEVVLPPDTGSLSPIVTDMYAGRIDQPLEAACLVGLSEHAGEAVVTWGSSDTTAVPEDERVQGVSYKTFTWKGHGIKEITCRVDYHYAGSRVTLQQRDTVIVLPFRFVDCERGDSLSVVAAKHPGMELVREWEEGATYVEELSPDGCYLFQFMYGRLAEFQYLRRTTDAGEDFYRGFVEWVEGQRNEFCEGVTVGAGENVGGAGELSPEEKDAVGKLNGGTPLSDAETALLDTAVAEGRAMYRAEVVYNHYDVRVQRVSLALFRQEDAYLWMIMY